MHHLPGATASAGNQHYFTVDVEEILDIEGE